MYEGKIFQAVRFASEKHKHQKRKVSGHSYIVHPMMVYHMTSLYSEDENTLIAALLHDTVEDTDTELEEIEENFGPQVREYVDILSEDKSLPWVERRKVYTKGFESAPQQVLLIKTADVFYNLSDMLYTAKSHPEKSLLGSTYPELWIDLKSDEIEIIKRAWKENPLLERVEKVFSELCLELEKLKEKTV